MKLQLPAGCSPGSDQFKSQQTSADWFWSQFLRAVSNQVSA